MYEGEVIHYTCMLCIFYAFSLVFVLFFIDDQPIPINGNFKITRPTTLITEVTYIKILKDFKTSVFIKF